MANLHVNHLLYADDLVVFAPSISGLRELLKIYDVFADSHDIKYNPNKSQVLISRGKCLSGVNIPLFAKAVAVYLKRIRPLSRRLDRCDRVIQNESRDPFGGNVYNVTMQITFFKRQFRNGGRNLHCDIVHITTKWVSSLTLDCNGVFAIKAYA